jgi:hypothetical protein
MEHPLKSIYQANSSKIQNQLLPQLQTSFSC